MRSSIAGILIALLLPAGAAAQQVPNPVQVSHDFPIGSSHTYNVDCWSSPQVRGTWLPITDSTLTTQEALIYNAGVLSRRARPSILYCFASDGKPGFISGAPDGLLLPPGSRVQVALTAEIIVTRSSGGKKYSFGFSIPLQDDTLIDSGPNGIVVSQNPHERAIYPAGSTLSVGRGETIGYYRPGTVLKPAPVPDATGCNVTYYNNAGEIARTIHYPQDCVQVPFSAPKY